MNALRALVEKWAKKSDGYSDYDNAADDLSDVLDALRCETCQHWTRMTPTLTVCNLAGSSFEADEFCSRHTPRETGATR